MRRGVSSTRRMQMRPYRGRGRPGESLKGCKCRMNHLLRGLLHTAKGLCRLHLQKSLFLKKAKPQRADMRFRICHLRVTHSPNKYSAISAPYRF
jgi:hypothetical protein